MKVVPYTFGVPQLVYPSYCSYLVTVQMSSYDYYIMDRPLQVLTAIRSEPLLLLQSQKHHR